MSLKQEIETWVAALAAYDCNEFDNALRCFEQIADTSKILFNVGVINATLGEHARAVEFYQRAVQLDQYLAVAYFQQGVSNFLMGDFEEALANFNDTLLYLRGNNKIDYEQLGLKFKLYSCEALFNRGLCYVYLQQKDAGMQDLRFASREKVVPDHDVIDEAIKEQAEGYTVFSIPVGIVYRPNEAKVKNLKTKDYLGKARLVASQDQQQNVDPRRQAALAAMGVDDRPQDKLSYAALNLVKPDLRSRSGRQQSEPPLNRNIFPPTPPPEPERPGSSNGFNKRSFEESPHSHSTTPSVQHSRPAAKPLRLDLGAAAFEQSQKSERPRLGTKRSESERPAMRREHSNHSTRSYDDRRRMERPMQQHDVPEVRIEEDVIVAYSPEVVQHQQQQRQQRDHVPSHPQPKKPSHSHHRSRSSAQAVNQPLPISEEDEEAESGVSDAALSPLAFEIIPPKHHPHSHSHHRHRSHSRRAPPPPPDLRKIRLKVHGEDTRYVMTTPTTPYAELADQIRAKFSLKGAFKLKIRDEEGDSITMGDQDDWEMAVGMCRVAAARERGEMGKMEVWVQEI